MTDVVVSVEGEGLRPVIWVIFQDVEPGALGCRRTAGHRCGLEAVGYTSKLIRAAASEQTTRQSVIGSVVRTRAELLRVTED